jgi:hypothetical protein
MSVVSESAMFYHKHHKKLKISKCYTLCSFVNKFFEQLVKLLKLIFWILNVVQQNLTTLLIKFKLMVFFIIFEANEDMNFD